MIQVNWRAELWGREEAVGVQKRVMKDQGVYGRKGRHCTRRRQMVMERDELGLGKLRSC